MDPSQPAPNELTDPEAYQRYLLMLLGDDDPAEVQASTPGALRALVAEAGERLTARPEPREWSVYGCLSHVTDAELVMSARYRFVLAHDEPPLIGYDQDRWVDRLHGDQGDVGPLLDLFDEIGEFVLRLLRPGLDAFDEGRQLFLRHPPN